MDSQGNRPENRAVVVADPPDHVGAHRADGGLRPDPRLPGGAAALFVMGTRVARGTR